MNLIKLYTCHAPIFIDSDELAKQGRTLLRIYTAQGNVKSETAKTHDERMKAGFGVHRNNLFATRKLAIENREIILKEMRK
jgi:hypothetical protein